MTELANEGREKILTSITVHVRQKQFDQVERKLLKKSKI